MMPHLKGKQDMHDELTKNDIRKMQEERDYRTNELMPELIEEVKRDRKSTRLNSSH